MREGGRSALVLRGGASSSYSLRLQVSAAYEPLAVLRGGSVGMCRLFQFQLCLRQQESLMDRAYALLGERPRASVGKLYLSCYTSFVQGVRTTTTWCRLFGRDRLALVWKKEVEDGVNSQRINDCKER